ncbi:MAG TPA: hypothetical protein ENJ30_04760 [Desulfobulbaceae bacterium]|nr:hypothetical protein [Desulfobulbaceae bacterium]
MKVIAVQEKRISFDELWKGLATDKEYGPGCEELLNKSLARHELTMQDFCDPATTLECHNKLIRIWLGYEGLPFYFPGKKQHVRFALDGITPQTFLEEIDCCQKIGVSWLDLAHFLFLQDLPLPAPDVKDKTIWFHGHHASTEFCSLNSDPYSLVDDELWDLLMEKKELEYRITTWAGQNADKPSELKIKEETLEELNSQLEKIITKIDAGSSCKSLKQQKLRPNQKHRKDARQAAKKLWHKNNDITIAAMVHHDDIVKACEGKNYKDRTLRTWINDLCPNRNPGRRPKKR